MEQKQLKKKKRNRFQKKEDKYTESIPSKAVEKGEIDSGLELTKEDTLKQFEDSEKDAQVNKKLKQTIKEHATDEETLTRDDEADFFQSFGSMADHRRKSVKTFSKLGCVQDIFVFTLTMTFFL